MSSAKHACGSYPTRSVLCTTGSAYCWPLPLKSITMLLLLLFRLQVLVVNAVSGNNALNETNKECCAQCAVCACNAVQAAVPCIHATSSPLQPPCQGESGEWQLAAATAGVHETCQGTAVTLTTLPRGALLFRVRAKCLSANSRATFRQLCSTRTAKQCQDLLASPYAHHQSTVLTQCMPASITHGLQLFRNALVKSTSPRHPAHLTTHDSASHCTPTPS